MKGMHVNKAVMGGAMAMVLTTMAGVSESAVSIDFNTAGGYTAGNDLGGQPGSGTQWVRTAGSSGVVSVTPRIGGPSGNNQASTSNAAATYTFTPTTADFGLAFNPATAIINFSFQVSYNAGTTTNSFRELARLSFGSNEAVRITFQSERVRFNDGTDLTRTARRSTGSGSANLQPIADVFYTLFGTINWATKTYTLSVTDANGTLAQVGAASNTNLAFANVTGLTAPTITFQTFVPTDSFRVVNLDNLNYTLIPEPATMAMLALGSTMLLARCRSQHE